MSDKKFDVYGVVTGGKYLGVFEAETPEEAAELAMESDEGGHISLCHQCASECEDGIVESATACEVKEDEEP
jgi:hypothetical protein